MPFRYKIIIQAILLILSGGFEAMAAYHSTLGFIYRVHVHPEIEPQIPGPAIVEVLLALLLVGVGAFLLGKRFSNRKQL